MVRNRSLTEPISLFENSSLSISLVDLSRLKISLGPGCSKAFSNSMSADVSDVRIYYGL